MKQMYI